MVVKILKCILLIVLVCLKFESSFCQNIEFFTENLLIKLNSDSKNEFQLICTIVNKNTYPIYLATYDNDNSGPRYEAAILSNEIVLRIGYSGIVNGMSLETSTRLLVLNQNDSLRVTINFNDYRFKEKIDVNKYKKLLKNISLDYLTDDDIKKIFKVNFGIRNVSGSEYSKNARFIKFRFSQTNT